MTLFEELTRRGLIAQMTNPDLVKEKLDSKEPLAFYIGFDATADSLHVGHFLQMVVMKHMQKAGHKPIALLGTGTTMIGDPTGKSDMRQMMTVEKIQHNADCFKRQMSRFIDFSDDKAIMVQNGDWLLNLNYIQFIRDIGVHFSVNKMLSAECYKARMENGLSFLEFNYMIMQSYDFLKLYEDYGCTLEMGGDDQWSNIIGGVNLVRKFHQKEVCGLTFTLLTTKEGKKMGKTEKGALWLDAEKTSPYEFFQYWRNISDEDVIHSMKLLTFIPIEEIEAMESWEGSKLNEAKEILAFELTKMVHGKEEADKALSAAKALFSNGAVDENMPSGSIDKTLVNDGKIGLLDLLVSCKLCPSKGEARRLVQQGGISLNDVKMTDPTALINIEDYTNGYVVVKKGKKVYFKVNL